MGLLGIKDNYDAKRTAKDIYRLFRQVGKDLRKENLDTPPKYNMVKLAKIILDLETYRYKEVVKELSDILIADSEKEVKVADNPLESKANIFWTNLNHFLIALSVNLKSIYNESNKDESILFSEESVKYSSKKLMLDLRGKINSKSKESNGGDSGSSYQELWMGLGAEDKELFPYFGHWKVETTMRAAEAELKKKVGQAKQLKFFVKKPGQVEEEEEEIKYGGSERVDKITYLQLLDAALYKKIEFNSQFIISRTTTTYVDSPTKRGKKRRNRKDIDFSLCKIIRLQRRGREKKDGGRIRSLIDVDQDTPMFHLTSVKTPEVKKVVRNLQFKSWNRWALIHVAHDRYDDVFVFIKAKKIYCVTKQQYVLSITKKILSDLGLEEIDAAMTLVMYPPNLEFEAEFGWFEAMSRINGLTRQAIAQAKDILQFLYEKKLIKKMAAKPEPRAFTFEEHVASGSCMAEYIQGILNYERGVKAPSQLIRNYQTFSFFLTEGKPYVPPQGIQGAGKAQGDFNDKVAPHFGGNSKVLLDNYCDRVTFGPIRELVNGHVIPHNYPTDYPSKSWQISKKLWEIISANLVELESIGFESVLAEMGTMYVSPVKVYAKDYTIHAEQRGLYMSGAVKVPGVNYLLRCPIKVPYTYKEVFSFDGGFTFVRGEFLALPEFMLMFDKLFLGDKNNLQDIKVEELSATNLKPLLEQRQELLAVANLHYQILSGVCYQLRQMFGDLVEPPAPKRLEQHFKTLHSLEEQLLKFKYIEKSCRAMVSGKEIEKLDERLNITSKRNGGNTPPPKKPLSPPFVRRLRTDSKKEELNRIYTPTTLKKSINVFELRTVDLTPTAGTPPDDAGRIAGGGGFAAMMSQYGGSLEERFCDDGESGEEEEDVVAGSNSPV